MFDILFQLSTLILPIILAISFHEAAHAYVAWKRGDDTAYRLNRVTLNPLAHIDIFGTLILPILTFLVSNFGFGWAKPVPVNFNRLKNPRYDMVLVALAGPAMNILLAIVAARLFYWTSMLLPPSIILEWILQNLLYFLIINIVLAVFNMIPIPPLDGGRVAVGLLPPALGDQLQKLEPYGFLILIGLIFILPLIGGSVGMNLDIIGWVVSEVVYEIIRALIPFTT